MVDAPVVVPDPELIVMQQQQVQQQAPGRFFSVNIIGAERSSTTFMVISKVFMIITFKYKPTHLRWRFGILHNSSDAHLRCIWSEDKITDGRMQNIFTQLTFN